MDSPGPSNLKRGRDDEFEDGEEEESTNGFIDDEFEPYKHGTVADLPASLDDMPQDESNYGFMDDEFEPHKFGTSVLPVANLPASFDGTPQDGMEYLFTVRREERLLPLVTRVHNPYAINYDTVRSKEDLDAEDVKSTSKLPSEEWRKCFEERFRNFRANIRQSTIHISIPHHAASPLRLPETCERDRWWAFLRGDANWEKVRGFPGQARGSGTNGRNKQQTIAYDEELPKNQGKMRGWVVYGEGLSWDQEVEDVVVDGVPSAGSSGTDPVEEEGSLQEDELSSDAALSPHNSNSEEVAAKNTLPSPRDSNPPEDATSADPAILRPTPREPTPELLNLINENATFQILRYFTLWIRAHLEPSSLSRPPPIYAAQPPDINHCQNLRYDLTPTHARWMFALLSQLDAQLTGGEISMLRTLAREIIKLIKKEIVTKERPHDAPDSNFSMGEIACWMILAAVTGVWGQRDLWMDAEAALQ